MNGKGEINCGFTGANPNLTIPDWRIIMRNSDNGSIVSNETLWGLNITRNHINDLKWIPDLSSGEDHAPNSKLIIGPVNSTHNQSSYQCFFETLQGTVTSSIATITALGKEDTYIRI